MKRPYFFGALVCVVLTVAVGIIYQFIFPLLSTSPISCSFGMRMFGCSTSFGALVTLVVAGAAVFVIFLWSKFSDPP